MSDYISVSAFDADLHRRMGREEIDTFCLDHMRRALSESEIPGNATQEQYVAGKSTFRNLEVPFDMYLLPL